MWCALVMDWQYPKVCISWRKNGLLNEVEQGFSSFLIDLMIFFQSKESKIIISSTTTNAKIWQKSDGKT